MVIAMIALCLMLLICFQGFMEGAMKQMINDIVRSETTDITVYSKAYRKDKVLHNRMLNHEDALSKITTIATVTHIHKRLSHDGMISSAYYSQGVTVVGINAEKEKDDFILSKRVKEGRYEFLTANSIVVGADLAKKLGTRIGRKLVLTIQDSKGEITGEAFRVVAIIRTHNPKIDRATVFIPLIKAQSLFNTNDVTQFSISVTDHDTLIKTHDLIQDKLGDNYDVVTWRNLFTSLQFMETSIRSYMKISYLILFIIIMIGFAGVIVMSILERVKEFGIMMAIGHTFSQIGRIIFLEALILALMGYGLGVSSGFLLLLIAQKTGINLSVFGAGFEQFGIATMIYPPISLSYALLPFIAVILTALVAIMWPLRILFKLNPIQSIQFN
tara:strand:+ start:770 stop:1927 length:1158 start_codon:yes stop_codon:yes gene_type:complete